MNKSISYKSGCTLWRAVLKKFSGKFPLQSGYAIEAQFLETRGDVFVVVVPDDLKIASINLMRPATKAAIESHLFSLSGHRFLFLVEVLPSK